MGLFGKSAQQKRIDALAFENAEMKANLAKLAKAKESAETKYTREVEAHAQTTEKYLTEINRGNRLAGRNADAHRALRDIVKMRTPHAAHAARKMAARAEDALPKDLAPRPAGNGVELAAHH